MLMAAPLAAQDHAEHGKNAGTQPQMDHCAMGHLPPEQCPPKEGDPPAETMVDPMAGMDHGAHRGMAEKSAAGAAPEDALPRRALEGPQHAADAIWGSAAMAPARRQLARENGGMVTGKIFVERLEARLATDGAEDGYVWDAQAWYGGDINRFVSRPKAKARSAARWRMRRSRRSTAALSAPSSICKRASASIPNPRRARIWWSAWRVLRPTCSMSTERCSCPTGAS
jgi:copper resistance protein B